MMNLDWGFALKLLSGLAGSLFGMMGVGVETRDKKTKRLTRNGWIALTGIIVSGLLSPGTSSYEQNEDAKKAREGKVKSDRLMLSVQRGIYPLKGIKGSLHITFTGDWLALKPYKDKLRRNLPSPILVRRLLTSNVCKTCLAG